MAVLMKIGDLSNAALRRVTDQLAHIQYGGDSRPMKAVDVKGFLPRDGPGEYVTYEGSTTEPGCQETVTWILVNRPIYATEKQLHSLRKLMQGEKKDPRAPLGGNFRPIQAVNGRLVRTNVAVRPARNEVKKVKIRRFIINESLFSGEEK